MLSTLFGVAYVFFKEQRCGIFIWTCIVQIIELGKDGLDAGAKSILWLKSPITT